ncbi:MAG: hypothetical protein FWF59_15310 [Turicibacter sp.]|nr:hypothetical protein [Turicibacter sp.]
MQQRTKKHNALFARHSALLEIHLDADGTELEALPETVGATHEILALKQELEVLRAKLASQVADEPSEEAFLPELEELEALRESLLESEAEKARLQEKLTLLQEEAGE